MMGDWGVETVCLYKGVIFVDCRLISLGEDIYLLSSFRRQSGRISQFLGCNLQVAICTFRQGNRWFTHAATLCLVGGARPATRTLPFTDKSHVMKIVMIIVPNVSITFLIA